MNAADIQDRDGAVDVLKAIRRRFPWLRHVFADGGYAGQKLRDAIACHDDWTIEIIKRSDAAKGFRVLPRRWVVERTFAWLGRCRRLAKDWETSVSSSTAWALLASMRMLTRRTQDTAMPDKLVNRALRGFPDAITAVFPETVVQTCIVHLLRNSMDFVSWKDRKNLASALKEVYRAPSAEAAEKALTEFEEGPWGQRYPAIGQSLAARLERGHPVLCVPRRDASDRLHHERYRGFELEASARRPCPRALPQRRGRYQAALPDLEPVGKRVE